MKNGASLVSLGFVLLSFVAAIALYRELPATMPVHWDAAGRANGFASRAFGAFVLPGTSALVVALLEAVPRISPRGYDVDRFSGAFGAVRITIAGFLFAVTVSVLLAATGAPVRVDRIVYLGTGLLFAVIGNFMGKFTKNFFVGIRTPWTLASDEVWLRTHRLAGKLFVLAGFVVAGASVFGAGPVVLATSVVAACGVPIVYSYLLYRRLEGSRSEPHG